jgi:excisionase family DNA binding protein
MYYKDYAILLETPWTDMLDCLVMGFDDDEDALQESGGDGRIRKPEATRPLLRPQKSGEDRWITKSEAAIALGRSQKTVERLAKAGKIGSKKDRRQGSKIVAVYKWADVERVGARMKAELSVTRLAFESGESVATHAPAPTSAEVLAQIAKTLSLPRIAEKFLLTLREAAALSGLPELHLEEALRSGKIKALNYGGSQLIRRADLIALIDQMLAE